MFLRDDALCFYCVSSFSSTVTEQCRRSLEVELMEVYIDAMLVSHYPSTRASKRYRVDPSGNRVHNPSNYHSNGTMMCTTTDYLSSLYAVVILETNK
jgi:hypothetical protein